jgi:hypothetical protein
MNTLTAMAIKIPFEILHILIVMIMALGFLCYKYLLKDENEPPHHNRPTPRRRTSGISRHKKQSLKDKRIAVKKNGQYTYYRINKYGEIFEEPNGEQ